MNAFNFFLKTKICFGEHSLHTLADHLPGGCSRAMIVTGKRSAEKNGYLQAVQDQLSKKEIASIHFNKVSPNPKVEEIDEAVTWIKDNQIDLVIGLGGGSVMDAAKAIAAMVFVDGKTEEVLHNQKKLSGERLPLVQIPTTAGTGSELSKGAILTDERSGIKSGLRGEVLLADVAVVDPTLTYSMSDELTMETGFDIFTHAVETYLSRQANRLTEMHSVEAINKVFKHLPKLKRDGNNVEARRELAFVSMLMGINLANSSTCLPHRLQYPIGALTNTSHPRGLAAIYPAWLNYSRLYNRDRFLQLAIKLGMKRDSEVATVNSFYETCCAFIEEIGLNLNVGTLGVGRSDLSWLMDKITGSLDNDPISQVEGIVEKIYNDSF